MKRFEDILYVVETGEARKPALERAVTLAANNEAKLTVIDFVERVASGICVPGGEPCSIDPHAAMPSSSAQSLEDLIHPYREQLKIQAKLLKGSPFIEIIREVLRNGHDLVIKSPETRKGLNRFFCGTDLHLIRKCPCPVWLIKSPARKPSHRILAAVGVGDLHPQEELKQRLELNLKIIEVADSLASCEFAELHIMHAWEMIGESAMRGGLIHISEEKVNAHVEQARQEHATWFDTLLREASSYLNRDNMNGYKPRTHLVKGPVRKEIPILAKRIEADLVVMGTVARTGTQRFLLGDTIEMILKQIDCSVLTIKPACFDTPVSLE